MVSLVTCQKFRIPLLAFSAHFFLVARDTYVKMDSRMLASYQFVTNVPGMLCKKIASAVYTVPSVTASVGQTVEVYLINESLVTRL
jgi:hypothetical protein